MALIYAGIGSRQTPQDMLETMYGLGSDLAKHGWTLRSGFANGADLAFYGGAREAKGKMEIYIPWGGFNRASPNDSRFIIPKTTYDLFIKAAQFHPNWGACTIGTKKLHARNVCQILGEDLNTKADMVICWTPGGLSIGGTGQAIRIARYYNIPVFDLAIKDNEQLLVDFVNQKEQKHGS